MSASPNDPKALVRATFKGEGAGADDKGFPVHFNPETLQYDLTNSLKAGKGKAVQFVEQTSAKLAMDLVFDSTGGGLDVRDDTRKLVALMTPVSEKKGGKRRPALVTFEWGNFIFKGYIESYKEVLELFSFNGVPLRARVSLVLTHQSEGFEEGAEQKKAGASAALNEKEFPLIEGQPLQDLVPTTHKARELAEQSGTEDPKNPGKDASSVTTSGGDGGAKGSGPTAGFALGLGLDGKVAGGAGFGASFGASAGASFGASAGASFGAGASAGASFGAGASAGASFGAGASAGASFGASAGASFGASAGASFGASAGASFGASAGAGASFGASAGAGASFGASAGAGASFGASAGAGASFGASAGASFGASATSGAGAKAAWETGAGGVDGDTAAALKAALTATAPRDPTRFTRQQAAGWSSSSTYNVELGLRARYAELRPEPPRGAPWSADEIRSPRVHEEVHGHTRFLPGGRAVSGASSGVRAEVDKPFVPGAGLRFDGE